MNLRHLEIFRAVMISGSASRAAELLEISQPAVSRSISELERSIAFSLFDRVRGRLLPTPEGQMFFQDVTRSFIGLDSLRSAAARIRDFGSGSLRVASLAALGATVVPRAIQRFRQAHPQIAITLHIVASSTVRELVTSEQFDLGLAADEVDLSGVDHRVFGSFRAVCAIPAGHPFTAKTVITPQDLHGTPFISLAAQDRARAQMTRIFEAESVRPAIIVETANSSTICALALAGVGVGLVNPWAAEEFTTTGLQFRPFEPAVLFKSHLLYRPDAQKAKLVKDFTAALLAERNKMYPGVTRGTAEAR